MKSCIEYHTTTSDGSGRRNLAFRFWKCLGEMGLREIDQGFSSFFANFLLYLMIFQSGAKGAMKF